jgi:hypothetical protein
MAVDPTTLQAGRLAIGQLRLAWAHADNPDRDRVRVHQPPTPARLERLATLHAAERAATTRAGALADHGAPADLAVIDAVTASHTAVHDSVWLIASDLRLLAGCRRRLEPAASDRNQGVALSGATASRNRSAV